MSNTVNHCQTPLNTVKHNQTPLCHTAASSQQQPLAQISLKYIELGDVDRDLGSGGRFLLAELRRGTVEKGRTMILSNLFRSQLDSLEQVRSQLN